VGPGTATANTATTRTGWVAGGGLEAALTGNWTAKIEYLYVDLGSQNLTFLDIVPRTTTLATNFRDNVHRAGVNYKLDWYGQVVAR
jgi:outer membrane immunogenic protein